MKKIALLSALAFLVPATAFADNYEIDPMHSHVGFSVRHAMVSTVHGKFDKFSGTLEINDKRPEDDKIVVEIDATSINTGVDKRDGHLKSPDFFDVAKFPKITFVSKIVRATEKGKLEVIGDFTMHGVTKSVVLAVDTVSPDVVNPMDKLKHRGARATTTINRQDFGVKWNVPLGKGAEEVMVGNDVKIEIDLEIVEKKAEKK